MKDDAYLKHILEAIDRLQSFNPDAAWDWQTSWAVERGIAIIGQAARNISKEFQAQHPAVPWSDIIGTRHRIIYDYFGISEQVLRDILREDLPVLKQQINAILRQP